MVHMMARGMVINCVAYARGRRLRDVAIDAIGAVLEDPDTFVWVGLLEPSEELLRDVQRQFGLHDLAIEDAHHAHQRPKIEAYGNTLFIVLHTAQVWEDAVHFGETHIFLGERYLVSVRHGASTTYAEVRSHAESNPALLAQGPAYALHALIDFVVDGYLPIVNAFQRRLQELEAEVFGGTLNRQTIQSLYAFTRELVTLRFAVDPLQDISRQLSRPRPGLIPQDIAPYFRDVYDHAVHIDEAIDTMREMVTAAIHVHLALVNIGQNDVVKRLAGWAAILALPAMVASVYGMNFDYMPELRWPFGYPLILGITAGACTLLYRYLKRKGWI